MDYAQVAAESALDAAVAGLAVAGVSAALQELTQDVWTSNVDRFEPDELGDTPNSLGFQAYQNFTQRALRRFSGDPREAVDKHWDIEGLSVTVPNNVLTLTFDGRRILVLKVPYSQGRRADFSQLVSWENQSHARSQMAARNTHVLGGYRSHVPGQGVLIPMPGEAGVVRDFILAWAGEQQSGLTACWLGVPVQGAEPFLAYRQLWWDEQGGAAGPIPNESIPTTTFNERPVATPNVTIKQRPAGEAEA